MTTADSRFPIDALPVDADPPDAEPAWDLATLFPNQGHWSEQEYLGLPNNRRVEFHNGFLQVLPVPTDLHQAIAGFLYRILWSFVDAGKRGTARFSGLKVKVSPEQFREPDVVFIRAENASRRGDQFWLWADQVMEVVSDGYRQHDLELKRREYALGGFPEYWIVDPLLKELTVLNLVGSGYEPAGVFRPGDTAVSTILPRLSASVTDVFNAD